MTLTGPQAKQIQDVFLAAFDRAELAQMVQFQLGETLDQIAGGTDLTEIVFNLVRWADRNGRLLDLIDGALAANPESPTARSSTRSKRLASGPARRRRSALPGPAILRCGRHRPLFWAREPDRRACGLSARASFPGRDRRLGQRQVIGGACRRCAGTGRRSDAGRRYAAAQGQRDWLVYIQTPTARPLKALSASLTKGSESVTAQATLMDDMAKDARSVDLYISRLIGRLACRPSAAGRGPV